MKLTTTFRLFSVTATAIATLLFTSSAHSKDNEAGGDDPEKKEKKVDTPDSLTDELIAQMNVFTDVVLSAKDKASAEAAVKKMNDVASKFESIASRLDKLETPSDDERQRIDTKMEAAGDKMQAKMKKSMGEIMVNPEVGQILGPAIMEFGKRMSKLDPIFKRFGKGSKDDKGGKDGE